MTIGGYGWEKGIAAACPARFRKTTKKTAGFPPPFSSR